ncbi:MAG: alginate lyase family protein [Armatimonadota bacterium]|nr:alginate lyase family protein [Armatimonadota bacterium]
MRKAAGALAFLLAVVCSSSCSAGEVLDRLLNNMVLDVSNGPVNYKQFKTITPDNPIGQTFTTGPKIVEVSRIAIADAWWHASWTEDESLVLTLWDSPAKSKQIASAEMPYKWRAWEGGVIMFTLNAPVQPSTQYYFELTVKGGDGQIVGIFLGGRYEGGQAYEGGKPAQNNIWFEVHSRPVFDRDAAYADRFSRWNLDYPGLEKVKAAVAAKDWDRAVDELIKYYESRPDLVNPQDKPKKNPKYDTSQDDLVLEMKYKDPAGTIVDLGPNWNHYREWPTRGGVGLTRTGLFKNFRSAYLNTGDEKYAKAFNEFMFHFLDDMPSPLRAGVIKPGDKRVNAAPEPGLAGGSMWAGLSIGARMNQIWWAYSGMHASPNFTRDIRAAWIFNMVDMAEVLALQKGGGNWESQMTTALYSLAERHPELAKSKEWFEQGVAEMINNLWTTSRADGSVQEPTFGYTTLIINRYKALLDTCKKLNRPLEPKYIKRVEKTLEYLMYNTEPDGLLPSRGDTFNYVSSKSQLEWGAGYYGREDFRYVATNGKEGKRPLGTSAFFPIGGWAVMRSDWSPEALYLNLHNGKDMGHGHADELSVVIDAYGRKLIVDPGCYIYGTKYHAELYKSRNHATVTVDDADTEVREMGANKWASLRTVDYFEGTNTGYEGLPGDILHTRRILFVKPDYWLLEDAVSGSGEHEVASRFPFYPGEVALDARTNTCFTRNSGANVLIKLCADQNFKAELYDYGLPVGEAKLDPAKGLKYSTKCTLPVKFHTLVFPYRGERPPRVGIAAIEGSVYKIDLPDGRGTDFICFDSANTRQVRFDGRASVVRVADGGPLCFAWVDGKTLEFQGRVLASSDKPLRSLEVIYDKDSVRVLASNPEPSLRVATLGRKNCIVGYGTPTAVEGDIIAPFAGNK